MTSVDTHRSPFASSPSQQGKDSPRKPGDPSNGTTSQSRSPRDSVPHGHDEAGQAEFVSARNQLRLGHIPPATVLLNVYDIIGANTILAALGIGVHHTGIEVYGVEYAFGRCRSGTGVFSITPKTCPGHVFRESIVLGVTDMTQDEVKGLIRNLSVKTEWAGSSYHLLRNNCNCFSEVLSSKLVATPFDEPGIYQPRKFSLQGARPALNDSNGGEDGENDGARAPRSQYSPSRSEQTRRRSSSTFQAIPPAPGSPEVQTPPSPSLSSGIFPAPEPLTPGWTNRIARVATTLLPQSLCEKIDLMDKRAQGLA